MQNYKGNAYINGNIYKQKSELIYSYDSIRICVCVGGGGVVIHILVPFKCVTNTHLLTGVPALCSKICHLQGRNSTDFGV